VERQANQQPFNLGQDHDQPGGDCHETCLPGEQTELAGQERCEGQLSHANPGWHCNGNEPDEPGCAHDEYRSRQIYEGREQDCLADKVDGTAVENPQDYAEHNNCTPDMEWGGTSALRVTSTPPLSKPEYQAW